MTSFASNNFYYLAVVTHSNFHMAHEKNLEFLSLVVQFDEVEDPRHHQIRCQNLGFGGAQA
jgi:hypothetical protein